MSSVTKRDIIIDLSNEGGKTHAEVENSIDALLGLVFDRLAEGRHVSLRGFGTFEVCVAKSKIGRNPNIPGSEVRIPDRCVVKFRPAQELKQRVARVAVEKVAALKNHRAAEESGVDL